MRSIAGSSALAVALTIAAPPQAAPTDPGEPRAVSVGEPAAHSPVQRGNARRAGTTTTRLPMEPRVAWRSRAPAAIAHAPAVDRDGHVVISTRSGEIVELDPSGKTTRRVDLGAPPVTPPAVLLGNDRVVVTNRGQVVRFGSAMPPKRTALPVRTSAKEGSLVPLSDGGAVVALGRHVVRLSAELDTTMAAIARSPIRSLAVWRDRIYVAQTNGDVESWDSLGRLRRIGSVGGFPNGDVAITRSGMLLAVVDHRRLVEVDVSTGSRAVRHVAKKDDSLGHSPAVADGSVYLATFAATLITHRGSAESATEIPLAGTTLVRGVGTVVPCPVVVDPTGAVGFALAGRGAGVVHPSGQVMLVEEVACDDPIAAIGAGERRLVVACASGAVWALSDRAS